MASTKQPDGVNSRNKALSIATYKFSTLYTNILQSKLKSVMRELINFCFKSGRKQFIPVRKFGAAGTEKKMRLRQLLIKLR